MTGKLPINIDHLLRQRPIEGERIEYKAGWNPQSVLHTICAFANDFHNLGGGYVVLGVEEQNGRPILPPKGINPDAIDALQKELLNLGHAAIQPHYHPLTATYNVDGQTILILWVPGGETRPYKAKVNLSAERNDWAYFIRRHSSTVRAKGQDERELLSLAATVPFDDRYRQTASLDDLSHRLIREFLGEIGSELAAEAAGLSVEDLGKRLNIVGGPPEAMFPKNVGLLFFNEQPDRFFPATEHETEQDKSLINKEKGQDTPQVTDQDTDQVEQLVIALTGEMSRTELQMALQLRHRRHFTTAYLKPALKAGLIEMTLPDKPTSRHQCYRRTAAGEALATRLKTTP